MSNGACVVMPHSSGSSSSSAAKRVAQSHNPPAEHSIKHGTVLAYYLLISSDIRYINNASGFGKGS